jgi:heme/copper-type cytochrome/quinol oxidase subunit 2
MHPFNSNEMFILALVALSIVGVICLGLLIVLVVFITGQKREREQQKNQTNIVNPPIEKTPPAKPPNGEESYLSVSDWITFFSNVKSSFTSTYYSVLAIIVTLFIILDSTSIPVSWRIVAMPVFIVLVLCLYNYKPFKPVQELSKLAKDILEEIMLGKLNNALEIQKKWIDGRKMIMDKWKIKDKKQK